MKRYDCLIKISEADNVAVALRDIRKGEVFRVGVKAIVTLQNIRINHKIALKDITQGADIIKYGTAIGHASKAIRAGEHVHSHNMATNLGAILEYAYSPAFVPQKPAEKVKFMGYVREDGSVGVRNEIWIVNTVGCVNKTAENLACKANARFAGSTDGIFTFPHPFGCSQTGEDQLHTQKILAGLVNHPNAAGVLVLGLGCENNNISVFKEVVCGVNPDRVRFLSVQDVNDEIEEGLKLIGELVCYAKSFTRTKCPASKLTVGLKCGGSDALSGITANPLLGRFSDMLITQGGSGILTEVPEMFGAETFLMSRCTDQTVFQKVVELINGFKGYFVEHNEIVSENPSPGNKEGGITTLEEKSMGCIQKGGTQKIVDVLGYGEKVNEPGLNLLWGPGNDIVATTALTAAGAQIILFSTGRGTPLGAPAPTVKVSSNTRLFEWKPNWIDFNAGTLLDEENIDNIEKDFFDFVFRLASGEIRTKNERYGYREISIFKDGVTL